tara:strand:+ start:38 stop:181 length:144 start_codon:yes stop_codon:yes gene_type:complete
MKHNYNKAIADYRQQRIEAMSKHIKELKDKIEFLEAQLEINQQAYYE